jgi:glycosyltransferase involved in cell wall biosynthesis
MGDGPRRAWLERRRAELGLESRVHLLGFRTDARSLMAQCTVMAVPSELEGLGTSILEAMAAGVPVVATAVGGIPEVIQNGVTGRLVPPRNPEALAAALVEVLAHPDRALAWAEQGRLSVRRFDIERMVERTLEEYQRAIAARRGAA